MPATYEPIATTTLGSAASSYTFSSIPATYTDLRVVVYWKLDVAYYPSIRLNGNSSTVYSYTSLRGNGSSVSTQRDTSKTEGRLVTGIQTSNLSPAFVTFDIFNYTNATQNKTILATLSNDRNGTDAVGPGTVARDVILCRITSAITSLTLLGDSVYTPNNLAAGTIATLYGIKVA
jgi:hypothetical protein